MLPFDSDHWVAILFYILTVLAELLFYYLPFDSGHWTSTFFYILAVLAELRLFNRLTYVTGSLLYFTV